MGGSICPKSIDPLQRPILALNRSLKACLADWKATYGHESSLCADSVHLGDEVISHAVRFESDSMCGLIDSTTAESLAHEICQERIQLDIILGKASLAICGA
jgi:hypothetical protein